MVTPLHVEIAMHYHCRTDQHPMIANEVHHRYAGDLVRAGLLRRRPATGSETIDPYEATLGLPVWIEAICSVPFPVQQWVIPTAENPGSP